MIPILLCIDIEPNARSTKIGERPRWTGYERSHRLLQELRQELADATGSGVHFNWFLRMDHQVELTYGTRHWAADTYGDLLDEAVAQGDEVGLHNHAWRWDEQKGEWVIDYSDPSWLAEEIGLSLTAFRKSLGRECATFRYGDRWMSTATMNFVEDCGVKYDLTVEPGYPPEPGGDPSRETILGEFSDTTAVPRAPYRPSRADFRLPDPLRSGGIWVFPVSTAYHVRRLRGRRELNRRLAEGLGLATHRSPGCVTLNLTMPPRGFRENVALNLGREEQSHLAIPMRVEAVLGKSRWSVRKNVRHLARHPRVREFAFATPQESARMLGLSGETRAEASAA